MDTFLQSTEQIITFLKHGELFINYKLDNDLSSKHFEYSYMTVKTSWKTIVLFVS